MFKNNDQTATANIIALKTDIYYCHISKCFDDEHLCYILTTKIQCHGSQKYDYKEHYKFFNEQLNFISDKPELISVKKPDYYDMAHFFIFDRSRFNKRFAKYFDMASIDVNVNLLCGMAFGLIVNLNLPDAITTCKELADDFDSDTAVQQSERIHKILIDLVKSYHWIIQNNPNDIYLWDECFQPLEKAASFKIYDFMVGLFLMIFQVFGHQIEYQSHPAFTKRFGSFHKVKDYIYRGPSYVNPYNPDDFRKNITEILADLFSIRDDIIAANSNSMLPTRH